MQIVPPNKESGVPWLLGSFRIVTRIAVCLHMALPSDIFILVGHSADGLGTHRAHQNSHIPSICIRAIVTFVLSVLQAKHLREFHQQTPKSDATSANE